MLAKKCLFMGIFTLLSVSLAFADPPAVHPLTGEELVIDCLRGTPNAIDGDLSDWNLDAMTPAVLDTEEQLSSDSANTAAWDGPDDSSGKFYMLWDDENIYIAVVMKDDTLSQNKTGGDIWNADAVEVFFSTTNVVPDCSEHYQYGFDFKEQTWNWCNMDGAGQSAIDYLQVASSETPDGYICEAAIEYGQMLSLDFSVGNIIGFHPVFDDTDNGDREIQMTWTGRAAHDQSLGYGYLFLSDAAAVKPGLSSGPSPADGAMHNESWVTLSWSPGTFAVSHDVYLGDVFDDVNDATRDSDFYRGNQMLTYYVAGFPGYAYPDGLVPGTTYYWRIDEVNAPPDETVYKGDVWSFSIPPKTAYDPVPTDGAESVELNANLSWTPGFGADLHVVYFGNDYDEVNNATEGVQTGAASYSPGPLKLAQTYFWRVDENDGIATYRGDVWSFSTVGAVGNPNPPDGAVNVKASQTLTWNAGALAASHEVYFGTDAEAVKNATKASPEYKGLKALGEESYDPGLLSFETMYAWRIDEVNDVHPDSPWKGRVWGFTTSDFFVVDDFEDYTDDDAAGEAIWQSWIDGFGVADNGAQVGYLTPPYAELTIVQGGSQSMPLLYTNEAGVTNSEVVLNLTALRDWTSEGVEELSLWFRGYPASVGSFVEGPAWTYTVTASGTDIWGNADEFHYAFKTLTGPGSLTARVVSLTNTNNWAKAGVMIRETLDADSVHATMVITPAQGISSQRRISTGGASTSDDSATGNEVAPYWIKIERDLGGNFSASYSTNGTTWQVHGTPQNIQMSTNVYIGLAVTSHSAGATCEAKFSNVQTTGTVSEQWLNQDIGIVSNDPEPLYVAVSNNGGAPAVVVHDDANAAAIATWTQWVIPLSAFADEGINLTNVDKIAIGLGSKSGMAATGGSGTVYIDDIRLHRAEPQP